MTLFEKTEIADIAKTEIRPTVERVPQAEVREQEGLPSREALQKLEAELGLRQHEARESARAAAASAMDAVREAAPQNFMLVSVRGEHGVDTESRREIAVLPSLEEAERLKSLLMGYGRRAEDFGIEETGEKADIQNASEYSRMVPRKQKGEVAAVPEDEPGFWEKVQAAWHNFLENYV